MKVDATSLSRLHDIVEPPPVSWWPLAPGWYVVAVIAAILAAALIYHQWRRWRANAYRREALRELESANTVAAISEVLRRASLTMTPRSALARLSGAAWPAWLADCFPESFPEELSTALASEAYRDGDSKYDLTALREQAARWIRYHQLSESKPN